MKTFKKEIYDRCFSWAYRIFVSETDKCYFKTVDDEYFTTKYNQFIVLPDCQNG
jgi:hypothetical protein